MSLQIGQQLGSYQITSLLGKGGMGEVYKAYDSRLDRTVAIKVLAAHVAHDPQSRERFQREARAVAALNHPHICTLHDIGNQDGIDFLVMEYLEGGTLAARLAKGPLPFHHVLRYGVQIVSALDKAHRAGIVHRDLKPGNIMLTKAGAKLLDFGLAKASVGMVTDMPTMASASDLTAPGAILGTLQYMAPEQIEGKKTDARTDIFAFGAVLYEMLTGKKAFEGKSQAGLLASILEHDPPPLTTVLPLASPALDRLIKRCISKDPDGRWQSAGDLTSELEWIAEAGAEASTGPSVSSGTDSGSRVRMAWTVAALAIVVAAALAVPAVMYFRRTAPVADTPTVQHVSRMTHENGFSEWPTWSPDGSLFAFSSNKNGNFELYVGRVEGGQEVVNVTNSAADDVQPAFSRDGTTIAFVSTRSSRTGLVKIGTFIGFDTRTYGGDLWVTPALGGQARRLAENANFPVWHPGNRAVLYVTGQDNHRAINAVSTDGGAPTSILPPTASTWEIVRLAYSPDARWITFETADRQLFVMAAAGGAPTQLLRGSSHVWDPAGRRIYYVNRETAGGTRIEAAEMQQSAAKPTVTRVLVVGVSTGDLQHLAIAPDGKHLLASGVEESLNLTRVPLATGGGDVAGLEQELSSGQVRDRFPAVSPDGRRIALSSNRIGDEELWMLDLSSTRWQRVQLPANTGDWITEACWAKDGQHLMAKRFFRNGTGALWYAAIDGSSTEQVLPPTPILTGTFACEFSPDGRHVVYAHLAGNVSQLFVLDVASRREQQLTRSESDKYQAAWSPDGRWVAFSANTGGTVQVWRVPADGGEERQITVGYERMLHLFYLPDGRWLYVQPSHRNIYRMPSDGGQIQPVTHFPESGLFIEEPTISPDGRYLLYNRGHGGSSVWMLTIGTSSAR